MQLFITKRKNCNNKSMFDHRVLKHAMISIISLIIFSAIFFLIHVDTIIQHDDDSLHHPSSSSSSSKGIIPQKSKESQTEIKLEAGVVRSTTTLTVSHIALNSLQEGNHREVEIMDNDDDEERGNTLLVAPINVSESERISWFRGKMHEFKILKSDKLAREFHGRVLGFFGNNNGCEGQFFMTWISPATSFGSRELLSVQSVFKVHPKACLVILSRSLDSVRGYRVLKPVLDLGFKVQAITPDLSFLFKGTPAEYWFHQLRKGKKDPGEIPLFQNLSNLIRLSVLYKYGGVYLDTDFILLKPFTGLRNCIGAQSMDLGQKHWTRLNNAVLVFDMNHPLLLRFIKEFALTFDGNKWGHNGPYLVSRVVSKLGRKSGFNFTILPPMAFYPVDWNKIDGLFRKPKTRSESKWVEAKLVQLTGESYGVHLWNKQSGRLVIEEGSILGKLVSHHCVICKTLL
ncbi:uncharacterized protein [Arachis hypogaea]|uniref:uncharacterized protein n=1 Tax=Arachis hypogaea TaxID=3818 RepID=UPI000DED04F5|nr:lactosylceramide 4-alpha-galactosyltransferase [Arachis hypogaea]